MKALMHKRYSRSRSGQAMAEMIVAIVAIVALFAGMLGIIRLATTRSSTMIQARYEAGQFALADIQMSEAPSPLFIADWTTGNDQRRHSADDEPQIADPSVAIGALLQPSRPGFSTTLDGYVPGNPVSALNAAGFMTAIGLVHARVTSNNVQLLPAVQHLIYGSDNIRVESDVTMTWSRGIN